MPVKNPDPPALRYAEPQFKADAAAAFPEIREELIEYEGVHMAMGALADLASDAISRSDMATLDRIAGFLVEVLQRPGIDPEIENAVVISFLEYETLQATRKGRKAYNRLPDSLKQILRKQW